MRLSVRWTTVHSKARIIPNAGNRRRICADGLFSYDVAQEVKQSLLDSAPVEEDTTRFDYNPPMAANQSMQRKGPLMTSPHSLDQLQ